jgi:hypothetical protein
VIWAYQTKDRLFVSKMEQSTLEKFEYLCTQDSPPACQSYCPIQVEAGAITTLVASGHIDEARKTLERHMPLAGLCGRLCEGLCLPHCLRTNLDSPVNIPVIELEIVRTGRPVKIFPMPVTKNKVAILGSGLSALVCAYCLALKGHKAIIYHLGPPGGALHGLAEEKLPRQVLEEAINTLKDLKVEFKEIDTFRLATTEDGLLGAWPGILEEHGAVFLSTDDPKLTEIAPGVRLGLPEADPVTRGINVEKVFLGPTEDSTRHINSMSVGKKAAASMDRLFQEIGRAHV